MTWHVLFPLLLCAAQLAIQQAVVELLRLYFLSAQLSPGLHVPVHLQADLFAVAAAVAQPSVLAAFAQKHVAILQLLLKDWLAECVWA